MSENEVVQDVVSEEVSNEESSTEETQDEIVSEVGSSEEPTAAEVKEVQKEIKRLLDLKIDGQDKSFKLDDDNDVAELKRLAQLGGAGQKRMQEAAELKKQAESLLAELKSNPKATLSSLGLDVNEFATQIIEEQIERLSKSPEQIEREEFLKEKEAFMTEKQRIQAEKEQREIEALQTQAANELESEITEALANEKDLPKTGYSIKRIADAMLYVIENGNPNVKVKDVLPFVKRQINAEIQELIRTLPEDMIEQYIGSDIFENQRKRRLQSAKKAQAAMPAAIPQTGNSQAAKPEVKKIAQRDFLFGKK